MKRQGNYACRMLEPDVQKLNLIFSKLFRDQFFKWLQQSELAQTDFDRYFPKTYLTEKNLVFGIFN